MGTFISQIYRSTGGSSDESVNDPDMFFSDSADVRSSGDESFKEDDMYGLDDNLEAASESSDDTDDEYVSDSVADVCPSGDEPFKEDDMHGLDDNLEAVGEFLDDMDDEDVEISRPQDSDLVRPYASPDISRDLTLIRATASFTCSKTCSRGPTI